MERMYGLLSPEIKKKYDCWLEGIVLCVPISFCEGTVIQVRSENSGARLNIYIYIYFGFG